MYNTSTFHVDCATWTVPRGLCHVGSQISETRAWVFAGLCYSSEVSVTHQVMSSVVPTIKKAEAQRRRQFLNTKLGLSAKLKRWRLAFATNTAAIDQKQSKITELLAEIKSLNADNEIIQQLGKHANSVRAQVDEIQEGAAETVIRERLAAKAQAIADATTRRGSALTVNELLTSMPSLSVTPDSGTSSDSDISALGELTVNTH